MKTILITGASSAIGNRIIAKLKKNKFNIICQTNTKKNIRNSNNINFYKCNFLKVGDLKKLNKIIIKKKLHIDAIIHLPSAKLKLKRLNEYKWSEFDEQFKIQVRSIHLIMSNLIKNNILSENSKLFIVSSSATKGIPPKGISNYILAKHLLEKYFQIFKKELLIKGVQVFILKPKAFKSPLYSLMPKYFNNKDFAKSELEIKKIVNSIKNKLL